MELTNEFRVSVPLDDAWSILTDVERIAPCMPGAQLQEIEGDEYRGIVKVKVGPITAQYKGKATFVSKDDAAKEAVLKAEGRDTRGQGNASATITATLHADGDGTAVKVVTDLTVTGKVAQFGRGVLADVSGKLLTQFVDCLHDDLLSTGAAAAPSVDVTDSKAAAAGSNGHAAGGNGHVATAAAPAAPAETVTATSTPSTPASEAPPSGPTVRKVEHREAEAVDLLDAAGVPVAKRAIPLVAGVLLLVWFLRRRNRRRR